MITLEEVLRAGKKRIREEQVLADAFSFYYEQEFRKKAKICCTFSDFNKLLNSTKNYNINMSGELKKYKVLYKSKKILTFSKDGKTHRRYAGRVDDAWLDDFFKHGGGKQLSDIDKMIIKVEEPKKKEAAKKPTKVKTEKAVPTKKVEKKQEAKKDEE